MRRKTYPYVLFFAAFWILVKDKDIEDGGVILGDEMGLIGLNTASYGVETVCPTQKN